MIMNIFLFLVTIKVAILKENERKRDRERVKLLINRKCKIKHNKYMEIDNF